METTKPKQYYLNRAETYIAMLYDKGFISRDCSYESIRALVECTARLLELETESCIKAYDLCKSIRGMKP